MSHSIRKCDCGTVISQCRCPSPDKTVTIVPKGCAKCSAPPPEHISLVDPRHPMWFTFFGGGE